MKTVVLGAGGFIGGHLTKRLQQEGHQVVGFDVKPPQEWWQIHGASYANLDLGNPRNYHWLVRKLDDADEVYLLAADMGGMGFIENHKLECMLRLPLRRRRGRSWSPLLRVVGVRVRGGQAAGHRRPSAPRGGRVPGDA
jgi:hypothetical protein